MTERPILFSAPMVRAILDGSKTQTRRIVKPGKDHRTGCELAPCEIAGEVNNGDYCNSPYGYPEDRLYVREAWRTIAGLDAHSGNTIAEMCINAGYRLPWSPLQYEADGTRTNWENVTTPPYVGEPLPGRYRHARFMPRWASRIDCLIKAVRVEKLQDISNTDALAEGVSVHPDFHNLPRSSIYSPVGAFQDLWNKINGAGSWEANPWVWVIEFERVKP